MRLIKLYSNNSLFRTVQFKRNLNLVLGIINNPDDIENDAHNLGKTTLIKLIDFMLLKSVDKKFFLLKCPDFLNDIFYLEVQNNDNKFITIRRSVLKNTKISLKYSNNDITCDELTEWDYTDLSLNAKDDKKNPLFLLNDFFEIQVNGKNVEYRKILSYFLRTQDDYGNVFKLAKFLGKDINWKPMLLELLGFDSTPMIQKYALEQEIEEKEKVKEEISKNFSFDLDKSSIKNQINLLEVELEKKNALIDSFNMEMLDDDNIKKLVNDVDKQISMYNSKKYAILSEIQLIDEALVENKVYDLQETEKIFKEFKVYFGDQIKKDYQSLIDFNNKISNERIKYLNKTKTNKITILNEVKTELSRLYDKQKYLTSNLNESDFIKKISALNNEITEIKNQLNNLSNEYENADQVKQCEKKINTLKSKIPLIVNEVENSISADNQMLSSVQVTFADLINKIIQKTAALFVTLNSNDNVEFVDKIIDNNKETEEDQGNTYKKIMCACFDLSLLISNINNKFIRFVYHDGVLESLEKRKRKLYYRTIKKLCETYDIQYIFSAIDGEICDDFDDYSICCVELNDSKDDSGRLFGRKF